MLKNFYPVICVDTEKYLKKVLDRKGYGGAVLMDLSKAFDTINYDLLLAKIQAYGFTNKSLRFHKSYLTKNKDREQSQYKL